MVILHCLSLLFKTVTNGRMIHDVNDFYDKCLISHCHSRNSRVVEDRPLTGFVPWGQDMLESTKSMSKGINVNTCPEYLNRKACQYREEWDTVSCSIVSRQLRLHSNPACSQTSAHQISCYMRWALLSKVFSSEWNKSCQSLVFGKVLGEGVSYAVDNQTTKKHHDDKRLKSEFKTFLWWVLKILWKVQLSKRDQCLG